MFWIRCKKLSILGPQLLSNGWLQFEARWTSNCSLSGIDFLSKVSIVLQNLWPKCTAADLTQKAMQELHRSSLCMAPRDTKNILLIRNIFSLKIYLFFKNIILRIFIPNNDLEISYVLPSWNVPNQFNIPILQPEINHNLSAENNQIIKYFTC
jgi:hypothetical protein